LLICLYIGFAKKSFCFVIFPQSKFPATPATIHISRKFWRLDSEWKSRIYDHNEGLAKIGHYFDADKVEDQIPPKVFSRRSDAFLVVKKTDVTALNSKKHLF